MSTHKSKSKKRSRDSEIALLERISASLDTYMEGRAAIAPSATTTTTTTTTTMTDGGGEGVGSSASAAGSPSGDGSAAAASDLLAARALVGAIARACAREGVVGAEDGSLVDALVDEYGGRYPSLVGAAIVDGIARHVDDDDDLHAAPPPAARGGVDDDHGDEGDGGRRSSKFARIVAAVESDMREYEGKIDAIRIRRSLGEATGASSSGRTAAASASSSSIAASKSKRSSGGDRPVGGKGGGKKNMKKKDDDDEARLVEEIARRYAGERDALQRLPNGHLEDIVDATKRELGLEHVELGSMVKLDKRVRWRYNKHRDREGATAKNRMFVEEIYARYVRTKMAANGGKLRGGTFDSIIESVRLELGMLPDPRRMRAIRNIVQARFTREHPELEPANPKRLKIGELSEEDKRRREVLVNEVTARYVRTKEAHGKVKMADGTLARIIEECKFDLGIHDFDVPEPSIRGRINRKSLHVQKLGKGSLQYDAIDVPLVATINSWSGEGIPITRDQGLDLANQLLRGKRMEKDDDGNDVVLDAQWWRNFLHRNKKKIACEIS